MENKTQNEQISRNNPQRLDMLMIFICDTYKGSEQF